MLCSTGKTLLALPALLPLALVTSGVSAPLAAQGSTLAGAVRDASTGVGLETARITLDRGDYETLTDEDGQFWFRDLLPGRYELAIEYLERSSKRMMITVPAHPVVQMEFAIDIEPVPVEDLRVTVARAPVSLGRLAGFYERLESGRGRFLTRKEFELTSSRRLIDALRRVPGVRVRICTRGGLTGDDGCDPITIRTCAPNQVWIDGFKIDAAGMHDIVNTNTETLEGVEIYSAGNVPAQFHPGRFSACTLVIWSRRQLS